MATGEARGDTKHDTAESTAKPLPLYAVCDRRSGTGALRILAEFTEPEDARRHAMMLRWAGSPAQVLLVSAIVETAE